MPTIDVSHTQMNFRLADNCITLEFESDDHTHIVLTGSRVGYITGTYSYFMLVLNDAHHLEVTHNSHNIAKNIVGNAMYVVVQIICRDDLCEITFGEDFGTDLIITSSSHGKSLSDHFEKYHNT